MAGEVKPPTAGGKGTHTRYCYLIRKRGDPNARDPKCWCQTGAAPPQPAAPPPTATTDRDKLIAEITGAGQVKPNTGAGSGTQPAPAPAATGGAGVTSMFVTGGLFRFIGARLNKLFDTEDFSLTHEEADALADAFTAAVGTSGKPMNPWVAFIVMMVCWLAIPMLEHAPKLIAKYSKQEKDEHGNPIKKQSGGFLGLKLRRPEPAPAPAYEPRPGAGIAGGVGAAG